MKEVGLKNTFHISIDVFKFKYLRNLTTIKSSKYSNTIKMVIF